MKKHVGLLLAILPFLAPAFCQDEHIQRPTLGIYFFFHDFTSADRIRFGKLRDMSPGLALNYMNGLTSHFDLTTTLTGSFIDYYKRNGALLGQDNLLLEGDVSMKYKIFSNRYWVSPYLQVGTGVSKYRAYWGAFIPAGMGMQVNLFDEAFFIFNAQYRVAVTSTVSNHYFYSLGIAGNIAGRRKNENRSVLPE
ncbi:MAG TPA: hypothetical protein VM187_04150 [Niastella sp.]|nr:hypothetical protein [Niastella sp.]